MSKNFNMDMLTRTDNRLLQDKNRKMASLDSEVTKNLNLVMDTLLEPILTLFPKGITVHSGYRCPELNASVGGSATSQHCFGQACDFLPNGYSTDEEVRAAFDLIIKKLPKLVFGQLLIEHGCLHISLGTKKECAFYDVKTKTKVIVKP